MIHQHTYLYVEDDPLSREVMQMILRDGLGVERLSIFDDSADLLARVEALPEPPDVFLLDIHLRPYNGFEALAMLRSHPAYARAQVIALTASVMNEEVAALRSAGFDGTIAKPISITTFPGLLERILAGEAIWHIS